MSKVKEDNQEKYSKKKFLQSNIYSSFDKDILKIILEDNKKYSKSEVDQLLKDFKAKEVK
jgi:hypothetical protein